ncbi:MAG: hypothetical protein ACLFRI_07275 [Candidatus Izemoplasmataceae bacterium]
MKKLYFGLTLMLSGAIITAGAIIGTGSAIGGNHAFGALGYQFSDHDSGSFFISLGFLLFFSGMLIAFLEAFKKEK